MAIRDPQRVDMSAPDSNEASSLASSTNGRISLSTSLTIVAAIAVSCALVVQILKRYAAIPQTSVPACSAVYSIPAVLLALVLGSTASFAWRNLSITGLASEVALSGSLLIWRLWSPAADAFLDLSEFHPVFWPVACFGLFFVTPLLLRRFYQAGDWVWPLVDSTAVAMLTYYFVIAAYVPRV
jgi:hypothetical protein